MIYNTLIPLEEFKALMGVDDREDKLAKFCLVTAAYTIEQYCKRRFLRKKYFEMIEYTGDLSLPLKEYPVKHVLAVFLHGNGEILEPDFYNVIPNCGSDQDIPFTFYFPVPFIGTYHNRGNVYLLIGFDTKANPIEILYNEFGENGVNVFHAMKCRNQFL